MNIFQNKKNILWDFDGVLIDSAVIREKGFVEVLGHFPQNQVKELLDFHRRNGGLSRYVKFRYFFENIRKEEVAEEKLLHFAESFSRIMRKELTSRKYLIADYLAILQREYRNFEMHLISGSDGDELRYLADQLSIKGFFHSIVGSPTPKTELLRILMTQHDYFPSQTVYIGDSLNDFEAADANGISFFGYNNQDLRPFGQAYINSFSNETSQ